MMYGPINIRLISFVHELLLLVYCTVMAVERCIFSNRMVRIYILRLRPRYIQYARRDTCKVRAVVYLQYMIR